MRFIRTELSPANKKQYLLAVGRKDIELLHGEAINALRFMPHMGDTNKEDRRRLSGIVRGLADAFKQAEQDGDEGDRLPIEERQAYKDAEDKNPMAHINRLEIIDHRSCPSCRGRMTANYLQKDGSYKEGLCDRCDGSGTRGGRNVIVGGPAYGYPDNVDISSSIQDQGRTLKLFIQERDK